MGYPYNYGGKRRLEALRASGDTAETGGWRRLSADAYRYARSDHRF